MMSDELVKRGPFREQDLVPDKPLSGSAKLELRTYISPTLIYDGSFEGLLCGLNQLLMNQVTPGEIVSNSRYQPALFEEAAVVPTSGDEASLTWEKITSFYSRESQRNIVTAFSADDPDKELTIYNYLILGLEKGHDLDRCHSVDCVRVMHELCQKVRYEAHRLKGLLRFSEVEGGIYYGPFDSDHLVICQLANFFKNRLNDQRWVLHDRTRDLMIYWDTEQLNHAIPDFSNGEPVITESESHYQELWRTFFRAIAIKERQNPKLQRQFMPQRYWSYLTEMT